MSIQSALQRAIRAGDLAYLPMPRSDPVERVILLGREMQAFFGSASSGTVHRKIRVAKALADMQAFVRGDIIPVCLTPRSHGEVFLGRLEPVGLSMFDMRCRDPKPSLRVLGRFIRTDVFVALDWWPRFRKAPWSAKEPLTDNDRWSAAISECVNKWDGMLPGIFPVSGEKVEGYVARNYDPY